MANQDIVNYLKEGVSRGFSVERLKEELLKNNFPEKDVDEAIKAMNPVKPLPNAYSPAISGEKKEGKFMKIAGIIGIIMFLLGMIGFGISVYNLSKASAGVPIMSPADFSGGTQTSFSDLVSISIFGIEIGWPMATFIFLITLAMFILFYYGFVQMGKFTGSALLKDSAWGIMFTPAIFGAVLVISYLIFSKMYEAMTASTSSLGLGAMPDFTNIKTLAIVLVGVWIAVMIFYLIMQILFSIGLLQAGRQVKFAKTSGVLNLFYIASSVGAIIYLVIIVNSIYQVFASGQFIAMALSGINPFSGLYNSTLIMSFVAVASELLGLLGILFASLALFDASNKFE